MLFSQESEYGIRIIRALKNGEKRKLKDICDEEQIPEAFAYKIAKKLSRSGLVVIKRGAFGGYILGRDLHTFTLKDIVEAIEPDQPIRACVNAPCPLNAREGGCRVHCEVLRLQAEVDRMMSEKDMFEILVEEK